MNYIILDFEWDTVFYAPEKRFINQIVQIGAVKLDEEFHSAGKFEQLVRSPFSKKVSSRFTELTGISTEDMLSGIPLKDAVEKYISFRLTLTNCLYGNSIFFLPTGTENNPFNPVCTVLTVVTIRLLDIGAERSGSQCCRWSWNGHYSS